MISESRLPASKGACMLPIATVETSPWIAAVGEPVVLDLASPYVVLGTLDRVEGTCLRLTEADVHDLRDSKTTRELYVLEARRHGIRCNRHVATVRIAEIVSFSRLEDVVD